MSSFPRRMAAFTGTVYECAAVAANRAQLDTVLVAQPSPAASSRSVSLRGCTVGLDSRGETPSESAGEDARATTLPGGAKNSVKMRPRKPWFALRRAA
jgi:hypothetical protein